jgi:hypothetical protein
MTSILFIYLFIFIVCSKCSGREVTRTRLNLHVIWIVYYAKRGWKGDFAKSNGSVEIEPTPLSSSVYNMDTSCTPTLWLRLLCLTSLWQQIWAVQNPLFTDKSLQKVLHARLFLGPGWDHHFVFGSQSTSVAITVACLIFKIKSKYYFFYFLKFIFNMNISNKNLEILKKLILRKNFKLLQKKNSILIAKTKIYFIISSWMSSYTVSFFYIRISSSKSLSGKSLGSRDLFFIWF